MPGRFCASLHFPKETEFCFRFCSGYQTYVSMRLISFSVTCEKNNKTGILIISIHAHLPVVSELAQSSFCFCPMPRLHRVQRDAMHSNSKQNLFAFSIFRFTSARERRVIKKKKNCFAALRAALHCTRSKLDTTQSSQK